MLSCSAFKYLKYQSKRLGSKMSLVVDVAIETMDMKYTKCNSKMADVSLTLHLSSFAACLGGSV